MTRKPKLERNRFTFKLYVRSLPSGQIYYVRFYDKNSSMILSRSEVAKIVELPVPDIIKPRPRLKDGKKNEGTPPIDIRMKAVVLLSELAAMIKAPKHLWGMLTMIPMKLLKRPGRHLV
jgi:hypothetical protein